MRVGPSGHTARRDSAWAGGAQPRAVRGQSRATAPHLQPPSSPLPSPLLGGGGAACYQAGWAHGGCGWLPVARHPRTAFAR